MGARYIEKERLWSCKWYVSEYLLFDIWSHIVELLWCATFADLLPSFMETNVDILMLAITDQLSVCNGIK